MNTISHDITLCENSELTLLTLSCRSASRLNEAHVGIDTSIAIAFHNWVRDATMRAEVSHRVNLLWQMKCENRLQRNIYP